MNIKTQAQILREVFQFGFGIIFLISLFYFTYNYLIPRVEDYSLIYQAKNLAEHANYLISKLYEPTRQALNYSVENEYEMPEKIWEYEYLIFMQESEVCCAIVDSKIEECAPLLVDSNNQGIFFSGGKLRITIIFNQSYSMVTLSN